jgi:hypothetical protein
VRFAVKGQIGPERFAVKIRAGYEISYDCPQPTPTILTLSVYPSRLTMSADFLVQDNGEPDAVEPQADSTPWKICLWRS